MEKVEIERPIVLPAYGRETALAILNIIKVHPELHDQTEWEAYSDCGTTRCIAGWAQWLHEGRVVDCDNSYDPNDVVNAARRYLDISEDDADWLFYSTNDALAVRALELLAAGESISALDAQ